jgi:opacity protein-like surface antigen
MRSRSLLLSAALAFGPLLSAGGQSTPAPTARFGIIGGANLATLGGSDVNDVGTRTGLAAGFMAVLSVSPEFAIQPELLFTMKGAKSNASNASAVAKIDYIEVPVLARYEIPVSGSVKPFIYGGPGFAYKTSCKLEGSSQGTTVSFDCDELLAQSGVANVKFSSTDVGGIVGGGLAFDVSGRTMTIGVRYEMGFVKLATDSDSKNRVFSFVGTFEWPFHK